MHGLVCAQRAAPGLRDDTWWPRYGVPGTTYGGPVGDNVDLTLESSLMIGLALGAHDYARGVLENFLTFGYRMDGPRFRGPSLTEQANQLSLMAQYYTQTGTAVLKTFPPCFAHFH